MVSNMTPSCGDEVKILR